MKNANDQNFFNFVGGGLRQRVIRYNFNELKAIYENYPLPDGISKKNLLYVKSIQTFCTKLFHLVFDIERSRTGK